MQKYIKKPVQILAIQWDGHNTNEVISAVQEFGGTIFVDHDTRKSDVAPFNTKKLVIETLEGNMSAKIGDYIIRGIQGEFYPCDATIFSKTYDKVEE